MPGGSCSSKPARAPSGGREGQAGGPARGGGSERTGWTFQGGSPAVNMRASGAAVVGLAPLDLSFILCLG